MPKRKIDESSHPRKRGPSKKSIGISGAAETDIYHQVTDCEKWGALRRYRSVYTGQKTLLASSHSDVAVGAIVAAESSGGNADAIAALGVVPGEEVCMLFRDPRRMAIIYKRMGGVAGTPKLWLYQMCFGRNPSNADLQSFPEIWFGNCFLPFTHANADISINFKQPHGNTMWCYKDSDGRHYFWLDATNARPSTIEIISEVNAPTGAQCPVNVWRYIGGGTPLLYDVGFIPPGYNFVDILVYVPGYYAIEVQSTDFATAQRVAAGSSNPDLGDILQDPNTALGTAANSWSVAIWGNCDCWAHVTMPQLFEQKAIWDQVRVLGANLHLQNVNNESQTEGSIAVADVAGAQQWIDITTYSKVLALPNANRWPLKEGAFAWSPIGHERDLELKEIWSSQSALWGNSPIPMNLDEEQMFRVIACHIGPSFAATSVGAGATAANADTLDVNIRLTSAQEFSSPSTWLVPLGPAEDTIKDWEAVQQKTQLLPGVLPNGKHEQILDKASKNQGGSSGLGDIFKEVLPYLPLLFLL